MLQRLDFAGKTALIIGASKGIGLATSKILAAYGATVILAARSIEIIEAQAQLIRSDELNALAVHCDVSNYDSVKSAVDFAVCNTGRLDILVNNAGVIDPLVTLIESDHQDWERAVDINYKGVYYGMRTAIPVMLEQGSGTVINMSSGAANSALVGWSHYCSTKAAAKKLTEVAHKELIGKNICVVGLSPGTVATDMMQKIRDAKINPVSNLDWNSHIPPEWVGEGVAFLCGELASKFSAVSFGAE